MSLFTTCQLGLFSFSVLHDSLSISLANKQFKPASSKPNAKPPQPANNSTTEYFFLGLGFLNFFLLNKNDNLSNCFNSFLCISVLPLGFILLSLFFLIQLLTVDLLVESISATNSLVK